MMNFKKIKWNHYINYIVIGALVAVLGVMTFIFMCITWHSSSSS